MNKTTQKVCAVAAPVMSFLLFVGFLVANVIPPPSPNDSPQEIADFYDDNLNRIRSGIVLAMFASALQAPLYALITWHLRRIRGAWGGLAWLQLLLGGLTVLEFIFPEMIMLVAAFRRDRDPDTLVALNDLAWLMFIATISTFFLQLIVIGVAILQDRGPDPVFPRWAGYLNLWAALMFVAGGFTVFFKTGPMAWDGVFVFWLPFVVGGLWFFAMAYILFRVIDEEPAAADLPGDLAERVSALEAGRDGVR